ncbi:ribosome silencing factor [Macromonas nakdongensis]|uniref:ribosome silencing factor n=1 Tax=Macromonas nakdongensis TaxID=1843082 RepID=UPI000C347649|nr:ribosome silencing factor [Macromonas nakdongensis]
MSSETVVKKNIQKLQRAIVDGLEDVKAHDIQVFNTELLSPLFERVIVASGTSNRQTKALAASVRDAVREAGFDKPRTEGEENGEWIIVDCGAAVVHVMQPSIRQYYRLEDIWGDKPVRLKHAAAAKVKADAAKSATPEAAPATKPKAKAKKAPALAAESAPRKTPARKSTAAGTAARSAARPAAGAAATKPRASRAAAGVRQASAPVEVVKVNAPSAKKATARKPAAKSVAGAAPKPVAKKAPAKSATAPRAPRKTAAGTAKKA